MERLFRVFDHNQSGNINFKEFILGMSVITRGSAVEKFKLSFDIYDVDGSGSIDKSEMREVIFLIFLCNCEHYIGCEMV